MGTLSPLDWGTLISVPPLEVAGEMSDMGRLVFPNETTEMTLSAYYCIDSFIKASCRSRAANH